MYQTAGFLYESFRRGSEFWQIHDLVLKMVLTGLLIYVPNTSRASVGAVVCTLAIANLNYFHPHKSPAPFWLTQVSFMTMCFKYVAALMLKIDATNADTDSAADRRVLGALLVGLDVMFLVSSVGAMGLAVHVLRSKLRRSPANKELSETTPRGGGVKVTPAAVASASALPRPEGEAKAKDPPTMMVNIITPSGGGQEGGGGDAREEDAEVTRLINSFEADERGLRHEQELQHERSKRKIEARLAARRKVRQNRALHRVPLFARVSDAGIDAVLDAMHLERFRAGDVLCRQGDVADRLYILVSGACAVSMAQPAPPPPPLPGSGSRSGTGTGATDVASAGTERLVDVAVGTLGELDVMGESCLVQEGHRDATVTATEAVQALSLHRDALARLEAQGVLDAGVEEKIHDVQAQHRRASHAALEHAAAAGSVLGGGGGAQGARSLFS